jgi:hypothetical protein
MIPEGKEEAGMTGDDWRGILLVLACVLDGLLIVYCAN